MFAALLYKITNNNTGMCYIGMTYSSKRQKDIIERFEVHMAGRGGVF